MPANMCAKSIDLTKVPLPPRLPTKSGDGQEERFEYSSREMKPAKLLLRDLLRAHSTFLMHHDSSLSALFVRSKRSKFVALLSRYWDLYLSTWDVMLRGNPAREIFGGINIAASGELGFGVGEEERGSGERAVLEGLVGRIEGLVDVVVSRFGDAEPEGDTKEPVKDEVPSWLGTGQEPGAEDGAVFLGTGALSKRSLRDVTHWVEDLYTWGEHAYGVIESPTSTRRRARRRKASRAAIPPPTSALKTAMNDNAKDNHTEPVKASTEASEQGEEGRLDKMVNYLKLGYGTYWSLPGGGSGDLSTETPSATKTDDSGVPHRPDLPRKRSSFDTVGQFLIGLKGDIEEASSEHDASPGLEETDPAEHNSRTVLRTINVEVESEADHRTEETIVKDFVHPASILTQSQVMGTLTPGYDSLNLNKAKKLRVVVYVNRPFIFAFLFELRTDSLAWDSLYRSLHYQLAPLKKALLASTNYRPERPKSGPAGSSIYDLVWDPDAFTVHSTIPCIPETYEPQDSWSRADALSTHLHVLNIHNYMRSHPLDVERTQKTGRGWWLVWTRLLDHSPQPDTNGLGTIQEDDDRSVQSARGSASEKQAGSSPGKEIILIRRASDHVGFRGEAEGAGRLAQGIGVDTRRYVEELLSLL